MTKSSTLTSTDEMLKLMFEEEVPCEMPPKDSRSKRKHNRGEWYLTLSCPYCPAQGSILICNLCRKLVLNNLHITFPCGSCNKPNAFKDAFVSLVRRG